MGSESDMAIMKKAEDLLKENSIEVQHFIASAHRTPKQVKQIAAEIEKKYDIVIAGAGMAAHLPGVLASLTHKPVIGVPIAASSLQGMDALLSIVQMPSGIPVATVAIDGAKNAAVLAMQILALKDKQIEKKFKKLRSALAQGGRL